jgi:MoaA/NifB/PqqE/SkfB family radical SAM enzyme
METREIEPLKRSRFFKHFPSASTAFNTGFRALRLYISNRSWKAWAAAGSHYLKRIRGIPTPTFVTVAATYRCQCRCAHCYSDSPGGPREEDMSTDQLKSVIRQVRGLGALAVHFSGGEPLLRKDIFDLVAYARGLGLLTRVNTNGILITPESARRLKAAGLTECGVSLDSADPAVHESFRGTPNLHAHALRAIRTLRRFGIPCRVMTVALKASVTSGLARTVALGRNLGARYMYILLPIAVGGWDLSYDQVLTVRERERIRELQDLTFAHLELPTEHTNCCVYRKSILYVSAQGNVTPCAFVPYVLGNINEQPLELIWRRHCASLSLECRGDCPMNIPTQREALRRHVCRVAGELSGPRPEAQITAFQSS